MGIQWKTDLAVDDARKFFCRSIPLGTAARISGMLSSVNTEREGYSKWETISFNLVTP